MSDWAQSLLPDVNFHLFLKEVSTNQMITLCPIRPRRRVGLLTQLQTMDSIADER